MQNKMLFFQYGMNYKYTMFLLFKEDLDAHLRKHDPTKRLRKVSIFLFDMH